jgi:hypothetical protein
VEQRPLERRALRAVAILSMNDPQFLREARTYLEGALETYGFALNDEEMEEARTYLARYDPDVPDEAIVRDLTAQALHADSRW